jgi:hypothetical protein
MNFYAYLWLREDGTPYYVGKGCRDRAFVNIGRSRCHAPEQSKIVILERDSEIEAFQTEQELIGNWGRKDLGTGCLYNLTNGGEGASGAVHSAEWKESIGKMFRGEGNPFFGKKHVAEFRKGHPVLEETRRKIAQANLGNCKALGHIGKTGSVEIMRECGNRGHHIRWHINRGLISPECSFCGVSQ